MTKSLHFFLPLPFGAAALGFAGFFAAGLAGFLAALAGGLAGLAVFAGFAGFAVLPLGFATVLGAAAAAAVAATAGSGVGSGLGSGFGLATIVGRLPSVRISVMRMTESSWR